MSADASRRSRGAGDGFALSSLPSSIRDAIRGLDKDGTGFVEEAEFVAAVEQMVQQRRDSRLLKQILAAVVVLNLLLTAAVVGCVWGLVVASVKDDTESTGGALADKATGAPLRTAAGFVAVGTSLEADADVLALWAEPDGAATLSRYLPFEGAALVYEKSVNASAVARVCALVDEGRDQMVALNVLAGTKRTLNIDVAACPAGGGASGAEIFVHYKGRGLLVRCPADLGEGGVCHLFSERPVNATNESAGAAALRSYLGPNAARAPVRVFAGALELRCDAGGECQVNGGTSARRRLLGGYDCPNCAGGTGGDAACLVCCYPCESNCQLTYAGCYNICGCYTRDLDCFPSDARVALEGGGAKAMAELAIGDRVLAADAAGRLFFDDVAFFGHREPAASALFVAVTTESGAVLRLTPDHFLPVVSDAACEAAGAGADLHAARELLPARAVTTAHRVWVADAAQALRLEKVVRVALAEHKGLFNPYTLSGSIVVDGVAASCHSSWIMDAAFAALGVPLPAGYQALFAPLRALYRAVGPATAEWLQGTAGAAVIEATLGLGRAPTGAPGQLSRLEARPGWAGASAPSH
jgi:hypothetical protein